MSKQDKRLGHIQPCCAIRLQYKEFTEHCVLSNARWILCINKKMMIRVP